MLDIDAYRLRTVVTASQVAARVRELGAQISHDYAGRSLLLVAVLRGGVYFAVDLSRQISLPLSLDFIEISTYGEPAGDQGAFDLHGVVRITKDLEEPVTGRTVLLVEDIIDTGLSLSYLLRALAARHPADIKVCTLVDAPARRLVSVPVDYCGFTLNDDNLVGCGLDYKQAWRNLPYLGVINTQA